MFSSGLSLFSFSLSLRLLLPLSSLSSRTFLEKTRFVSFLSFLPYLRILFPSPFRLVPFFSSFLFEIPSSFTFSSPSRLPCIFLSLSLFFYPVFFYLPSSQFHPSSFSPFFSPLVVCICRILYVTGETNAFLSPKKEYIYDVTQKR